MSIRKITIAVTVLLSAIVVTMVALDLRQVSEQWRRTADLKATTVTLAELNKGVIELSLERSLLQATLALPTAVDPAFRDMIDRQRRLSDEKFDLVTQRLEAAEPTPEARRFLEVLVDARTAIAELRTTADRNLSVPLDRRDATVLERLPVAMPAVIESMARSGEILRGAVGDVPARVTQQERVQRLAWAIREYSGRERTYMAIATARQEPIAGADRQTMAAMWGRAVAAWQDLQAIADGAPLEPSLAAAVERLERGHFGSYVDLRQSILAASEAAQPYPVDFDTYFTRSTEALDEAVALSYAAGEANIAIWDGYADQQFAVLVKDAVALAGVLLLAAGFLWYVIRRVCGRIAGLTDAITEIAGGRTDVSLDGLHGSDEIGGMAEAVRVFRDSQAEIERLRRSEADSAAEAEARAVADDARRQAANRMAETIERETTSAVEAVAQMSGQMDRAATDMAEASRSMQAEAAAVAEAVDAVLGTAETVTAATDQLSSSISAIDGQVGQATAATATTVKVGREARASLDALSEAVAKIGAVTDLISQIAEQTNLLALNATIEAARAGDAGRGFAVVAGEVKALAGQTANSTDEIARHISEVQSMTSRAVTAMEQVGSNVERLDGISAAIAGAIQEQSQAARNIAGNVQDTTEQVRDVSRRVGAVSKRAADTGHQAQSVGALSTDLHQSVASLRKTLVEVVRTSTDEADRRRNDRVAAEIPVTVTVGGRSLNLTTVDVSGTGLSVPRHPEISEGRSVTVRLASMSAPVAGTVVGTGDGRCRIRITDGGDGGRAFTDAVSRLVPGGAMALRAA